MNLLYDAMCRALTGFNVKAHNFSDAKEICKKRRINLTICEYNPDILGYYCIRKTEQRTKRFIMVNSILGEIDRTFIALHEIGHVFLHEPISAQHWFYCRRVARRTEQKYDSEADAFALIAMIPLWLMIDLQAANFSDISPALVPFLKRRYRLWQDYEI